MQWMPAETQVATSRTTNISSKNATYSRLWLTDSRGTQVSPHHIYLSRGQLGAGWSSPDSHFWYPLSSPWFNLFCTFIITVLCCFSFASSLTIFPTLSVTPWAYPQCVTQNGPRFKRLNSLTPLSECLLLFPFSHSVTLPISAFYLNQIHQSSDPLHLLPVCSFGSTSFPSWL